MCLCKVESHNQVTYLTQCAYHCMDIWHHVNKLTHVSEPIMEVTIDSSIVTYTHAFSLARHCFMPSRMPLHMCLSVLVCHKK